MPHPLNAREASRAIRRRILTDAPDGTLEVCGVGWPAWLAPHRRGDRGGTRRHIRRGPCTAIDWAEEPQRERRRSGFGMILAPMVIPSWLDLASVGGGRGASTILLPRN